MAYVKKTWKAGDVVSSSGLNNIENGVYNVTESVEGLDDKYIQDVNDTTKIYGRKKGSWVEVSTGTTDYTDLMNKPSINDVTLNGNKTLDNLGIQGKLTAGENITITDNVISASGGATIPSITISASQVDPSTYSLNLTDEQMAIITDEDVHIIHANIDTVLSEAFELGLSDLVFTKTMGDTAHPDYIILESTFSGINDMIFTNNTHNNVLTAVMLVKVSTKVAKLSHKNGVEVLPIVRLDDGEEPEREINYLQIDNEICQLSGMVYRISPQQSQVVSDTYVDEYSPNWEIVLNLAGETEDIAALKDLSIKSIVIDFSNLDTNRGYFVLDRMYRYWDDYAFEKICPRWSKATFDWFDEYYGSGNYDPMLKIRAEFYNNEGEYLLKLYSQDLFEQVPKAYKWYKETNTLEWNRCIGYYFPTV